MVVIATSLRDIRSVFLMNMQLNSPTRFSVSITVYGEFGGIANRTAVTSLSCQRLYEDVTFSDIFPSSCPFFFPPNKTVLAVILRLSRSITSWKPKEMMSGESTLLSTSCRKLMLMESWVRASGLAASMFQETIRRLRSRNVLNELSCFNSS